MRKRRRRGDIFIDLTSLLDVVMIVLLVVICHLQMLETSANDQNSETKKQLQAAEMKLGEAEIARGDSLLRASVSAAEQFSLSDRKRELPLEGQHFFSPLKGTVSQSFDPVLHPAVDITAPAGAVICSVLDGTVIFSDWTDANGYSIAIQHESGIISFYKHNQKLLRKAGEKVSAGTPVALVGNTGSLVEGDHLHLEIWHEGEPIDPARYCKF